MSRRRIWVTMLGITVLALVLSAARLVTTRDVATRKAAVHTDLLASSGAGRSGNTAVTNTRSQGAAALVPSSGVVQPYEVNVDLRQLTPVPANPLPPRPELEGSPAGPATKAGTPSPTPPTEDAGPGMPAPIQNFAGLSFTSPVTGGQAGAGYPPDTVGDVGPNHYVQAVNTSFAIYNKTGTQLAAQTFNSLWAGIPPASSPCGVDPADPTTFHHNGDPTVVYDPLGGRFFVADFAWADTLNGPYFECIAVSKTGDPVGGGWWLYALPASDAAHPWLNDYPKMGIWPDGLYITYNMFDCLNASCSSATFNGVRAQAIDRIAMEAGAGAAFITFDIANTNFFSLLPSNLRGASPPAGRENLLASESQTGFDWEIWKFHVNYATPVLSTFTGPFNVSQTLYACCTFPQIATPSAPNALDSLADRLMMQNQYRNIGGTESLWLTHTVPSFPNPGVLPELTQWAQINVTGGVVASPPVQQQIYGNLGADGLSRWMSSLAVDKAGNMAIGYSVANANTNPQIRYNGRLATDPLGTLPQGETILVAGGGTQTNNCGGAPCHRWGDYSAMTVDQDGCTFWYTTEYYVANGGNWNTRIGSFKYPTACQTTAAGITRFAATRTTRGVAVAWRTGTEAQILGFNVWRNGKRLNRTLITAKHTGRAGGASYRFADRTARSGRVYTYRLQVVDLKGRASWYGAGSTPAVR